MQSTHPNNRKQWLKKRIPFVLIMLILLAGYGIGVYAYNRSATEQLGTIHTASSNELQALDTTITATIKRKADERSAAESAAEASKTNNESQANTIDATVCNRSAVHADPSSIDVVVNKKHCVSPLTYQPADLVTVHGATLSVKAADSFSELYSAAAAAGQHISVTSSFRSYNDQVATYRHWVAQSGAEGADTYSARPGYSEHQTGLVVDVAAGGCVLDCFGSTSQYEWMQANAARYGFIQRYYAGYDAITGYKAEEWHYRYVGTDVAQAMQKQNIKTLEEYWDIEGGNY
jgi:D-alanyl-D-alanine carboxypeptidase